MCEFCGQTEGNVETFWNAIRRWLGGAGVCRGVANDRGGICHEATKRNAISRNVATANTEQYLPDFPTGVDPAGDFNEAGHEERAIAGPARGGDQSPGAVPSRLGIVSRRHWSGTLAPIFCGQKFLFSRKFTTEFVQLQNVSLEF